MNIEVQLFSIAAGYGLPMQRRTSSGQAQIRARLTAASKVLVHYFPSPQLWDVSRFSLNLELLKSRGL